jgi:anthranilate synthase/aminodeoxychorismate synthase-like glutamine amidotransferase
VTPRVLVLDNYDSFVHNLARYLRELGAETDVRRNDAVDVAQIEALAPTHLVVSPGPCTPREAGVSNAAIAALGPRIPVLGVCLGHQCLAAALGGRVVRAARPRHGKTSPILHDGRGLFAGLPNPFEAARYHSLVVEERSLPESLEVVARTPEGEIMALRHKSWPAWGVQFHPESILTKYGHELVRNFLTLRAEAA